MVDGRGVGTYTKKQTIYRLRVCILGTSTSLPEQCAKLPLPVAEGFGQCVGVGVYRCIFSVPICYKCLFADCGRVGGGIGCMEFLGLSLPVRSVCLAPFWKISYAEMIKYGFGTVIAT